MRPSSYPLVAVVTPILSDEKYLPGTMDSVQALDYPNLVHIVMDNTNTDETRTIIGRYGNRRVPLLIEHQPTSMSVAASWNVAVALVPPEARYFRILGCGTTLYPDAIIRCVEIAERDSNVGLIGSLWGGTALAGEDIFGNCEIVDGGEVVRGYLQKEHDVLSDVHVLFRRARIETHRPFYDEGVARFEIDANVRTGMTSKYGFIRRELGAGLNRSNGSTIGSSAEKLAHEFFWLTLLDRYGPQCLGFRAYLRCRTLHRRHHLRHLLAARIRDGDAQAFTNGLRRLHLADDPAGALDFAGAFAERVWLTRTGWHQFNGKPGRRMVSPHKASTAKQALEY